MTTTILTVPDALAAVTTALERRDQQRARLDEAELDLNEAMRTALRSGAKPSRIAAAANLSRTRVYSRTGLSSRDAVA